MDNELEMKIVGLIKGVNNHIGRLEHKKKVETNLRMEMDYIIKIEQKKHYKQGLKDALAIIQKK